MYYFLCVGKIRFGIRNGFRGNTNNIWKQENVVLLSRRCRKKNRNSRWKNVTFSGKSPWNISKKQQVKNENIRLYELDAFSFMMMDLDAMEKKIHSHQKMSKEQKWKKTITAGMIQSAVSHEMETGSGRTKSMVYRKL